MVLLSASKRRSITKLKSTNFSQPLDVPIKWQAPSDLTIKDPYSANWLLDTGSLTERLQSMCRRFSVDVVFHDKVMDDRYPANTVIRDVVLLGDGVPWVYAKSVIPQAINDTELEGLGKQPLGQRIFNDPRFVRGAFEVCQIQAMDLHQGLVAQRYALVDTAQLNASGNLLGRRSTFSFLDSQMSVAEIFLPLSPMYQSAKRV